MARGSRFWALIPAAGRGERMGGAVPKQYLTLAGRCVLERSLSLFINHARIAGVMVVLAQDDERWPLLKAAHSPRVRTVVGGPARADSVLAGLRQLQTQAAADDWVLVHDAARPCLTRAILDRLLAALENDPTGGLLALPARDTIKQAMDGRVTKTLDRSQLWQAQTPQMFRLGPLTQALADALNQGVEITDEAAAMEYAGHAPLLVEGSADNLKITRVEDLALAESILRRLPNGG
jgi:2-C-methyl-D-erythritol 4-phosphate cytidylyltransferase